MANTCCDFKDLGVGCSSIMDIAVGVIFAPLYDSDGTKVEFANAAAVTKSALTAKFDAASTLNRFRYLGGLENVENIREDTVFQDFNGGSRSKVRDGVRRFTAQVFRGSHPILKLAMDSLNCSANNLGVFFIDASGNFIGYTDASRVKLFPIPINASSYADTFNWRNDSEAENIMFMFDFQRIVNDGYLTYIKASDLDFTETDLFSLIDVSAAYSAISTTGFTATLTDNYGRPVAGLVEGDFAIYNTTTEAAVTIVTFTESADGVYDFTFALQASADELRLTPTKSKFDFADVVASLITI